MDRIKPDLPQERLAGELEAAPEHLLHIMRTEYGGKNYTWHGHQAICSCGHAEDLRFSMRTPGDPMQSEELANIAMRHARIVRGEKGIYGCGCTVSEQATSYHKRGMTCRLHGGKYIAKSPAKKPAMSAKEVVEHLARSYAAPKWAFFAELRVGTGYIQALDDIWEQRFDAWAIALWPSKKFLRIAFEVKVTRSDFLSEIKNPQKRQAAMALSNQFYFVTPQGLIKKEEIPDDCGLIEIKPTGGRLITVKAPVHDGLPEAPWRFLASIARRAERGPA